MKTQSRTAVVAEAHLAVVANPQEPYAPPIHGWTKKSSKSIKRGKDICIRKIYVYYMYDVL